MNIKIIGWLSMALVSALYVVQPVMAGSGTIPTVVLTDKSQSSSDRSKEFTASRQAAFARALQQIATDRAAMAKNGFVIVPDQQAELSDRFFGDIVAYQASHEGSYDLIPSRLGYSAIDPHGAAFGAGQLIALMPAAEDDGSIHHMFYAFERDDVGKLVIEELSFTTVPDATIRVAAPAGNVRINGTPGTYMVSSDESGSKFVSSLNFLTTNKMFTLTTSSRLEIGSDGYSALIAIAESLY